MKKILEDLYPDEYLFEENPDKAILHGYNEEEIVGHWITNATDEVEDSDEDYGIFYSESDSLNSEEMKME